MDSVDVVSLSSSLLAANFNGCWCYALNKQRSGEGVDYFAMLHSDIGPDDFWLDTLIDELESKDLDILGTAVPIKDQRGMTSLAIDGDDTWRPRCRLTVKEVARLPETFTSEDIGGRLLLNTGCWVCKFDPAWARQVRFTVNDRIVVNSDGRYMAEVEPEDWYFSRLCHELGLKVGATSKVPLMHRGEIDYSSRVVWGHDFDDEYGLRESMVGRGFPRDIPGWLTEAEGNELSRISAGKDVLEIGSYCGKSSICIAQTAKSLVCVDYWDGRATAVPVNTLDNFTKNIHDYEVDHKITTAHPDDRFPAKSFDIAFIDGDHSREAVLADIDKALDSLKPGGLIAFHDYQSEIDPGVTSAVDSFLASGAEIISQAETLAVVRPPISVLN